MPSVNTTITGNIAIGSSINVPINAKFPLKEKTTLTLDYVYQKDADHPTPPQGSIQDLTTWFKNTFSVDIPLPANVQTYAVQITRLHLETTGNAGVTAGFGKIVDGKFDDTWKPFDSINITLSKVTVDVERTA